VPTTRDESIDAFLSGITTLRKAVAGMSPEQLRARPVAGKWSTLEVACHLVDSDQIWSHRMKRVIAEDRPLLIGYDESRFTASLGYHERDLAAELDLMGAIRQQLAGVLRSLPESAWSRLGVHNEAGLLTLERMLELETEHVPHHVRTIVEKRRALGLPDPG
jgi:uncharacterized damage-inducible protein DinB